MLGELKAAALINCEFCVDIGSALARAAGVTDAQLAALPRLRDSDAFEVDKRVGLELAEAITTTPALVAWDLRRRLVERFSAAAVTEVAAAIAERTTVVASTRLWAYVPPVLPGSGMRRPRAGGESHRMTRRAAAMNRPEKAATALCLVLLTVAGRAFARLEMTGRRGCRECRVVKNNLV